MGERFNEELKKAEAISKYNKQRATRLLDDLGTAYLSTEFDGLDKSLISVKMARKYLTSKGYTVSEVDDYLLEKSYISKTNLSRLRRDSIYTDSESIMLRPEVERIVMAQDNRTSTDIIIDSLQSRPELLSALKRGISAQYITQKLKVPNATLLINFYEKHKDIINQ